MVPLVGHSSNINNKYALEERQQRGPHAAGCPTEARQIAEALTTRHAVREQAQAPATVGPASVPRRTAGLPLGALFFLEARVACWEVAWSWRGCEGGKLWTYGGRVLMLCPRAKSSLI
jgi:hypothetical protein